MKSLEFEKVSIDDARKALEGPDKSAEKTNVIVKRSSTGNGGLLEATRVWMESLPWEARPVELAERFPRIANSLAELWRQVARCEEYLDSLVVDRRGDRTGFPPNVTLELTKLRAHYAELHPNKGSAWDMVDRDR